MQIQHTAASIKNASHAATLSWIQQMISSGVQDVSDFSAMLGALNDSVAQSDIPEAKSGAAANPSKKSSAKTNPAESSQDQSKVVEGMAIIPAVLTKPQESLKKPENKDFSAGCSKEEKPKEEKESEVSEDNSVELVAIDTQVAVAASVVAQPSTCPTIKPEEETDITDFRYLLVLR